MRRQAHRRGAPADRYARPRSRYIRGKALYRAGNFNHALGLFRKVVEELTPEIGAIVKARLGADRTIDSITMEDVAALLREAARVGKPAENRDEWGIRVLICGVTHDLAMILRRLAIIAGRQTEPEVVEGVLQACAIACMADPWSADPAHNIALYFRHLGELEAARQFYEAALLLNPNAAETWTEVGGIFAEVGDRGRSDACYERALELPTQSLDARYNVSFVRLLKGDYERGWRDYESRWESPDFQHGYGRPELARPRWDGRETHRTVYLHQEQGAGDAIMMARYVPLVEARVGRVIVEVRRELVSLFSAIFPHVNVVATGGETPAHDFQCPLLSLPMVFGTTLQTVPDSPSFRLNFDESGSMPVDSGRIGLCWRGSTTHSNDRMRSMPFEAVFPLLDVDGYGWQSLQYDFAVESPLEPCPTGDFLETARAIARCGRVITVDTSVAHLAGLLDVETWLLLPHCAEWRWLQDRSDSPWYPSMQLFRQAAAGDWRGLTKRVAELLANRKEVAA